MSVHPLDRNDNAALSQLAVAYRRQGKPEKAKEALAALAKLDAEERVKATTGRIRLVKQSPASTS